MTNREFKRLSKSDLIKIIFQMKNTEIELRAELQAANEQLKDRSIKIQQAGSIAEAALSINKVFEDAQKAVDDYLKQVMTNYADVETSCSRMLIDTEEKCRKLEEETANRVNEMWAEFDKKAQEYIRTHAELENLLSKKNL